MFFSFWYCEGRIHMQAEPKGRKKKKIKIKLGLLNLVKSS